MKGFFLILLRGQKFCGFGQEGVGGDGDEGMVVVPRWVLLHTLKKKKRYIICRLEYLNYHAVIGNVFLSCLLNTSVSSVKAILVRK